MAMNSRISRMGILLFGGFASGLKPPYRRPLHNHCYRALQQMDMGNSRRAFHTTQPCQPHLAAHQLDTAKDIPQPFVLSDMALMEDVRTVEKTAELKSLEDVANVLSFARELANQRFGLILKGGPQTHTEKLIHDILQWELFHVKFVRRMVTELTGVESTHDWSKDYYYMVVCAMAFSLNRRYLVADIVRSEIERHFELEDHHPENVDYSKTHMTETAISEMAIDRLSRNLQFNQGTYRMEQMRNYEPKFRNCPECGPRSRSCPCQHEEEMLAIYWAKVEAYKDRIADRWEKLSRNMVYLKA